MLLVAPTLILSAFAVSPWQLLALVGCQLAAGSVVGALLPNMLQDMASAQLRGRIFAIYAVLGTPTSGLSVIAVGGLSDVLHTGPRDVLFAIAIIGMPACILGAALMHFAQRPFTRTSEICEIREELTGLGVALAPHRGFSTMVAKGCQTHAASAFRQSTLQAYSHPMRSCSRRTLTPQ